MELYLLEDHPFELKFKWIGTRTSLMRCGIANFFLRDKKLSPTGKGVVSKSRFPWSVDVMEKLAAEEMFGFHFHVKFTSQEGRFPGLLMNVAGDFAEMFKYAHEITEIPGVLKLKLDTTWTLSGDNYSISREKRISASDWFLKLTSGSVNKILNCGSTPASGTMTIQLMVENMMASGSGLTTPGDTLPAKILQEKRNPDFVLVADNDKEFSCHKCFLSVHSIFFERMFETDCKEMKSGKAKLNLSEEGLKALLDYVYCLRIDAPKGDPSITLELLEFAHEKQIPGLEAELKDLILGKPNDWMNLDEGLQLFLLSIRLEAQGYAEVKKKAVKSIKTKRNELKESAVFMKLMVTNPECVVELLQICME